MCNIFSADGKPLSLFTMKEHALGNPKGLCALPDGNLLVCDTHYGRVLEMTFAGDVVKTWGQPGKAPGQFTHPLSAAVDAKRGLAYIVEYGAYNDRVQVFSLDGTFVKCIGSFGDELGQFQRPSGIALDADGNFYVADAVNHRIQKFDPAGKALLAFGEFGKEPGQLKYPYDIAYWDGLLYVAEFNNHRVSVFQFEGRISARHRRPRHIAPGRILQPVEFDRGRARSVDGFGYRESSGCRFWICRCVSCRR